MSPNDNFIYVSDVEAGNEILNRSEYLFKENKKLSQEHSAIQKALLEIRILVEQFTNKKKRY